MGLISIKQSEGISIKARNITSKWTMQLIKCKTQWDTQFNCF